MKRPALQKKQVVVLQMAFRARKFSGLSRNVPLVPNILRKKKKVELKQTHHLWVFIQIYFRSLFSIRPWFHWHAHLIIFNGVLALLRLQ